MASRFFVFFKQKTADELRISDWSSDVCSSDLFAGCAAPLFGLLDLVECKQGALDAADLAQCQGQAIGPWIGAEPFQHDRCTHDARSEERRVGKACGSTCRYRWSPYH